MHGVSGKAFTVDAHVCHDVAVETVVMPHLLDGLVLKKGPECVENGGGLLCGLPILSLRVTPLAVCLQSRQLVVSPVLYLLCWAISDNHNLELE